MCVRKFAPIINVTFHLVVCKSSLILLRVRTTQCKYKLYFFLSIIGNLSLFVLLIFYLLPVCAAGQHSIIYQKISVPSETFTNLNKTLATTEDGVKQCGYICSIQNAICNIFKYDIAGHICTFGKVRIISEQ